MLDTQNQAMVSIALVHVCKTTTMKLWDTRIKQLSIGIGLWAGLALKEEEKKHFGLISFLVTIDVTSKVAVSNVALSTSLMKTTQQAVVVERDDATSNEADGASCPAQIGHDESWIAQDEGIVQCCNEMETHLPPTVCTAQL